MNSVHGMSPIVITSHPLKPFFTAHLKAATEEFPGALALIGSQGPTAQLHSLRNLWKMGRKPRRLFPYYLGEHLRCADFVNHEFSHMPDFETNRDKPTWVTLTISNMKED